MKRTNVASSKSMPCLPHLGSKHFKRDLPDALPAMASLIAFHLYAGGGVAQTH